MVGTRFKAIAEKLSGAADNVIYGGTPIRNVQSINVKESDFYQIRWQE